MNNNNFASQSTEARNSAISNIFSKKSVLDFAVYAYNKMAKSSNGNSDKISVVVGNGYRVTMNCGMDENECRLVLNIYLEEKNGNRYLKMREYHSGWVDMSTEYMACGSWKSVVVYAIKDAIESMVSKVLDNYIKDGDKWSIAEWEKLSGMVYMAPVLDEAEISVAPVLDEAPMLEEDDDVMVGYSVEGLAYVRENLEDVDVVSMLKESMGVLSNDPYTMESIMRGGVLDQEKFADALWDIVWEEHLCGLTDEALESETRYYTDFDALCLQLCGAVAAYNEVMRVVKNNADSVTYGAQGFSWDLFTEETMLTLMANNDLVDMLRKSLFAEVGCSDLLVYDDCLYLWYNNNSWETSIVTAA